MESISQNQINRWIGKRRAAQIGQFWSEGNGCQIVLKAGLVCKKYDTDGIFLCFEETAADNRDAVLDFFSDIVAVA